MSAPCPPADLFSSREFLVSSSHFLSLFTIPTNLFVAYMIVFHTPSTMKPMRKVMINVQVWSTIADVQVGSMTIPFIFFPLMAGVPSGLLNYLGISARFQAYITSCIISEVASSLCFLMERQQRHICGDKALIRRNCVQTALSVFNYTVSFAYIAPIYLFVPDQLTAKREFIAKEPCVDALFLDESVYVATDNYHLVAIAFSLCFATFYVQCAVNVIHSCRYLFSTVNRSAASRKTRRAQKKFLMAVCIQALVPSVLLGLPVAFFSFSIYTKYYNQALNNISFLTISLHGFMNSVCTILIYEHYRTFVLRKIFGVCGIIADRSRVSMTPNLAQSYLYFY